MTYSWHSSMFTYVSWLSTSDKVYVHCVHQLPDLRLQGIESLFIFCVVWSCGAALVQRPGVEDRIRFDRFIKAIAGMNTMDSDRVAAGSLPAKSIFEYNWDLGEKSWKSWKTYVTPYVHKPELMLSKIVVPTVDLVRSTWIVETIMNAEKPCLFVGESGTAKTLTIQAYLDSLNPTKNLLLTMNFSSRTTSHDVQRAIEDSTEKRTKDTYGPPVGKKLVVFLDDLNMPKVDLYGTQQPIALMKLFIERNGLYDRGKDLSWKKMKDINCIAGMGPPGGARNPVDPRFVSLFNVFEIQFPTTENLHTIFQSILVGHVAALSDDIKTASGLLTGITLDIYAHIIEKLPATPSRFHYIFNLRDLSRVFEGLMRSTPDKFESAPQFLRLWRNEMMRIFHDRLIDENDKGVVLELLRSVICSKFSSAAEYVLADPILFGNFATVPAMLEDDSGQAV